MMWTPVCPDCGEEVSLVVSDERHDGPKRFILECRGCHAYAGVAELVWGDEPKLVAELKE